ncbi:MAG: DNA gyrase inhibitor YacG [Candidatus Accumulibacter sp.]|nr:DNA gyrase inhibitor YacG [Accumulibacter sp.]
MQTLNIRRVVRCPQCGGESLWSPENPFRPFCSERCKLIDLGAWASDSYRIPDQGSGIGSQESGIRDQGSDQNPPPTPPLSGWGGS